MLSFTPNLAHHSQFARHTAELKAALDRSAQEMVTGRRSDPLRAVRGDQETLLRAQSVLDRAETDRARLTVLGGRYGVAATGLRTLSELTQGVVTGALAAADTAAGGAGLSFAAAEARTAMGSALGAMEARFGGRSVFGGELGSGQVTAGLASLQATLDAALTGVSGATDVEAAIASVFAPGGAYETAVYRGAGEGLDAELSGGAPLGPLPSASAEPVRLMLQGMAMTLHADRVPQGEREGFLERAAGTMQRAHEGLIALEASVGLSQQAIGREGVALDARLFDAEASLEGLLGRDPFEAATETQSLEARLQAAYTITGRLGALRLTNYLR